MLHTSPHPEIHLFRPSVRLSTYSTTVLHPSVHSLLEDLSISKSWLLWIYPWFFSFSKKVIFWQILVSGQLQNCLSPIWCKNWNQVCDEIFEKQCSITFKSQVKETPWLWTIDDLWMHLSHLIYVSVAIYVFLRNLIWFFHSFNSPIRCFIHSVLC